MSRFATSIPPDYFDAMYAADPDPWRFAASPYEAGKYAATLEALPRRRYASALEIGCSIGVLTRQIAMRCDALLSLDVAQGALTQAEERCRDRPGVRFALARVPGDWPSGSFDLVLLSEVLYYLDRDDLATVARLVGGALRAGGDVVLVHWTGDTHYPLSGDEAAELFTAASAPFALPYAHLRTDAYRLDVLRGVDLAPATP